MAGALSAVYLISTPMTADHGAQVFRVGLFETERSMIWNNHWFGGHHLPGYSVLSPVIGSWFGFRPMGVVSVLGSVLLFSLIVDRQWGERARAGAIWFGVAACVSLYSGRLTFALGVLIALLAVFLAQRGFRVASIGSAAAVSLASPVASLFLACAGLSYWLAVRLGRGPGEKRDTTGMELAIAAFLPALVISLLFPAGGTEPYVWSSFIPALALTLAAAALVPPGERVVRVGLLVYAAAIVATFLIDTPMGGNVNRMGVLFVGPLLACAAWPLSKRPAVLALVPFLIAWQLVPVLRDLSTVAGEDVVKASFYKPVERELEPELESDPGRVEVLPVKSHWESARMAPALPLARGWERQTDRRLNGLIYSDGMTAADYRNWLDRLSVHFVAVPNADLDYSADREAALVESGTDYLKETFRNRDWTIYRVSDPRPMVDPPARLADFRADSFAVQSPRAGVFRVAIRWTPYWTVEAGAGCVEEGPDGFVRLEFDRPGRIEVKTAFRPLARFDRGPRCAAG